MKTTPTKPRYRSLDFLGFPEYRVGSDGTVWSRYTREGFGSNIRVYVGTEWKKLKPSPGDKRGYLYVNFRTGVGKKKMFAVHRLVLEAFVGPCPPGHQARHFPDRNPANNRLENLKWGTSKENHADQKQHGTRIAGERHHWTTVPISTVQEIRRLYEIRLREGTYRHRYGTQKLAKRFGLSPTQVWRIVTDKSRIT